MILGYDIYESVSGLLYLIAISFSSLFSSLIYVFPTFAINQLEGFIRFLEIYKTASGMIQIILGHDIYNLYLVNSILLLTPSILFSLYWLCFTTFAIKHQSYYAESFSFFQIYKQVSNNANPLFALPLGVGQHFQSMWAKWKITSSTGCNQGWWTGRMATIK